MNGRREATLDFNFWPSFADLMLTLVLILLLVLFVVTVILKGSSVNLDVVRRNQLSIVNEIARATQSAPVSFLADTVTVVPSYSSAYQIKIVSEPTFQRITFSEGILFDIGDWHLRVRGRQVLGGLGQILIKNRDRISEIQFHGHADNMAPRPNAHYKSNLELGSLRAMEVFNFLKDSVGIDPCRFLMSATSFGEFKSVLRSEADTSFSMSRLIEDNGSDIRRQNNRRIELLLFYRRQ